MRRTLIVCLCVGAVSGCGGAGTSSVTAPGAAAASFPLRTSAPQIVGYRAVDYTRSFTLSGRLSTHKAGASVSLEASVCPFSSGFKAVAKTVTHAGGAFSFRVKLGAATRYRAVVAGGVQSTTLTVYALEHHLRTAYSVAQQTLHVADTYQLPSALVAATAARPAYLYVAIIPGKGPPTKLSRRATLTQQIVGADRIQERASTSLHVVGSGSFTYRFRLCFPDHEQQNGFGLPGNHHCGDPTIRQGTYLG